MSSIDKVVQVKGDVEIRKEMVDGPVITILLKRVVPGNERGTKILGGIVIQTW